jgi:hypothetical protein
VKKYGRGLCEVCLRRPADLPPGETLEAQHIIEFSEGGDPGPENIMIVCTACHRLVHWVRRYVRAARPEAAS